MEPIETKEIKSKTVKGLVLTVELHYDDSPPNPRTEFDGRLGRMVCWHNRYNLGDEQPSGDPQGFIVGLAAEKEPDLDDLIDYWENGNGYTRVRNFYMPREDSSSVYRKIAEGVDARVSRLISKALDKHYIYLPLYLYDHSGITMSTGPFFCPWDSGQVGYIFVSKEDIRKEYGWKILTKERVKKVLEWLEAEVKEYDQYLRGEVYGFVVKDQDGEWLDSCWGFFGDSDSCMEEATSSAEATLKDLEIKNMDAEEALEEVLA